MHCAIHPIFGMAILAQTICPPFSIIFFVNSSTDGTGKYRNEFGIMEKCESCQRADMTLEKVHAEPDSEEEGY